MLAAEFHPAGATTDQYVRLRVMVVPIAVAHVRSVHEDRVIEQRSLAVGCFRHLLNESRELLKVPRLDFGQLLNPLQNVGMMRYGMEGIRDTDVVVCPVRALRGHDVGDHACKVRLIREGHQVEHQLDLFGERVQLSYWSFGNLERGKILGSRLLRAPLDLANAFEIPVENS